MDLTGRRTWMKTILVKKIVEGKIVEVEEEVKDDYIADADADLQLEARTSSVQRDGGCRHVRVHEPGRADHRPAGQRQYTDHGNSQGTIS